MYNLDFVMAIKELLKSKPELLSELKYTGIPDKVLTSFMFDGKPAPEEGSNIIMHTYVCISNIALYARLVGKTNGENAIEVFLGQHSV